MKASKRFALAAIAAALAALFGLGLAWDRGPEDRKNQAAKPAPDVQKWTAETHDGTNFPLVGHHRTTACAECHIKGVFEGTPTTCESCHWDRRQDDRYKLRLGSHCEDCHTPMAWKAVTPGKWNHETITGFRLVGIHKTLDCAECHGEDFKKVGADCFSCHAENFRNAKNPDHVAGNFSTECATCHTNQVSWQGANVGHAGFPLKGQHAATACSACHPNGRFAGTPTECVGCHLADYNATTDPNHRASGFPTDCVSCHGDGAVSWTGGTTAHLNFPLKGQHRTLACSACHPNGRYAGTPNQCVGCHLADYNGTTDPNHKASNFPTDCVSCHGDGAVSWTGATFNHSQFFVLQGAHKTLDCNACHAKGYNLPTDCYGCHAADYNGTTDPNHKSAGFPTTCETCHLPTHTSWTQAVFQHDFPITSGKHAGFSCTDCHLTSNFREFSCTDCHTHNKATVDSHHSDVSGYSYNSQACYTCHPRGVAGG
jgi:hypothetical protein